MAELLIEAGHFVTASDVLLNSVETLQSEQQRWSTESLRLAQWEDLVAAFSDQQSKFRGRDSVGSVDSGDGIGSGDGTGSMGRFAETAASTAIYEIIAKGATFVASAAIPPNDPRMTWARARQIPVQWLSESLGSVFREIPQYCVAGTHGKTTTTGMLWWMLNESGAAPAGYIGGALSGTDRSGFFGAGRVAVIESCEYRSSFLSLNPNTIILTGMDRDHFDCFPAPGLADAAFSQFVEQLETAGKLIVSGDCRRARKLAERSGKKTITFGLTPGNDWTASEIVQDAAGGGVFIDLSRNDCGRISLQVPGDHNIANSLGAIAAAAEYGLTASQIRSSITGFQGIRRRFERRGQWRGMELIDDYAHHPAAVRAVLATARAIYPGRRLIAVFEPHQLSRISHLGDDFRQALLSADECLILPVLAAREESSAAACCRASGKLVRAINLTGGRAFLLANLDQVAGRIDHAGRPGDVVITMGAGRTNQIHDEYNRRLQRDFAA